MKTIKEMNSYFEALFALNSLYIWRYNGQVVTSQNIQDIYHEEHKANPNSKYDSNYYTKKYLEATKDPAHPRIGADCSGAFYQLSGYDNSAKGYYAEAIEKGDMSTFNPNVACQIFRGTSPEQIHHIGWYLGNGISIEMESSDTNCQRKVFDKTKWNYWAKPKFVDYSAEEKVSIKAIDISHHNTITNWDLLSSQVKDIIIRIGYRGSESGALAYDNKFLEHIKQAIEHNMNMGIYYYDQSLNETEAIMQADWCAMALKDYKDKISYPIYIDSEYANETHTGRADAISKEQRTKNVIAFCERIKSHGYQAGVYASNSWFKSMIEFDKIKQYEIWCARYSITKPSIGKYESWQYGSEQFTWAVKPIDVNYFYKDYVKNRKQTIPATPTNPTVDFKWFEQLQDMLCVVYNAPKGLFIRSEPRADADNIGLLANNTKIKTIGVTSNGWWKIDNGKYISGKYCKQAIGEVYNCDSLFIRSKPISTSKDIGHLHDGDIVTILDEMDGFYYIRLSDGTKGYSSTQFIKIV